MRRMTRYFFEGLLIMAPIAITLYVCYRVFNWIDRPIRELILDRFHVTIPGVGFIITGVLSLLALTFVGFLSGHLATRHLLDLLDRQFARFPMIKILYSSLKDFVGAFVGDKKRFDQPVLVNIIPGSDVKLVGFVTCKTMELWGMNDQVAVYLPMAFNFGGNLIIVPRARIQPLDVPSSDAMAFVVSGGIAGEAQDKATPPV